MVMDKRTEKQKEFEEYVFELVKDSWEREHLAYQLTALGSVIARERSDYQQLIGMKLQPFLQLVMRDRLHFIKHSSKGATYGVVPIDVELPENTDELFVRRRKIRFDKSFWMAFASPLFAGKRVVELHKSGDEITSFTVRELPNEETIPPGAVDIPLKYITGTEFLPLAEHIRKVYENVETWLEENELDPAVFRSQQPFQERPGAPVELRDFVRVLEMIDKSDQERIHIPLDIVIKLLGRM